MRRETLSQNPHARGAVAHGACHDGGCAFSRVTVGWHSPGAPGGLQQHRRNQPEPGEPALPGRGGRGLCRC